MKTPSFTLRCATATLLGAVSLITNTSAQLIYEQTFESMNVGALGTQGGLQGNGDAGNVAQVVGSGQSYLNGPVDIPGGNRSFTVTAWNPNQVGFQSTSGAFAAQTGDVFFSYVYNYTGTLNANAFNWFTFGNTVGGIDSTLGVVQRSGLLQARIRPGSSNNVSTGFTFSPGSYLIAGRISKSGANGANYDTVEFWTNPTTLSLPTNPSEYANTQSLTINSTIGQISAFRFLIGASADQYPGQIFIDNIRLGTTWNSVVIPEPSSVLLLAGAGVALLAVRRRRKS